MKKAIKLILAGFLLAQSAGAGAYLIRRHVATSCLEAGVPVQFLMFCAVAEHRSKLIAADILDKNVITSAIEIVNPFDASQYQ